MADGCPPAGTGCPAVAGWLASNIPPPRPPDPSTTAREKALAKLSVVQYMAQRRAGGLTCEEYAGVLVKRMRYYSYMKQFMYWESFPNQTEYILAQARALDAKAAAQGVDAIAPLYGLPFPVKGTVATVDFPSSAGSGVLHREYAAKDAAMVALLRERHAVIMGKTNVPEFACSLVTANYANGRALNPYDHSLVTCGSSGGSASAVATYVAPIALTEDTGGSTRCPALHQNNFGYDPVRNHYPNDGNPGLTYTNDQLGLNARSLADILAFDAALLGTEAEHAAAAAAAPAAAALRVGTPRRPYLFRQDGAVGGPGHVVRATEGVEAHLLVVEAALQSAGLALVEAEWNCTGGSVEAVASSSAATYTAAGQMSSWVYHRLDADVSAKAVVQDMHQLGASHDPAQCFRATGDETETAYRAFMASRPDALHEYNSIFEEHHLDLLLLPAQMSEPASYVAAANATVPVRVDNVTVQTSLGDAATWMFWKAIPVPKLLVPTGLDAFGRPRGIMLFGRGPPAAQMFNDSFARTFDLPFLYRAKAAVQALTEADPTLRRVHAPLVDDLFA